nr:GNAT family N-acetyltransferase [Tetragenococcus muriaticus]
MEWQQALNKTNQTYFGNNTWIRAAAYYLRYQVFVLEQKIAPSLEFDEKTNTIHNYLVVLNQKEPVATIRFDIYKNHTISPDRFCVAKSVRNQGIGSSLLNDFEKKALGLGYKYSLLSAEKQAIPFYQKNGYQIASEEYLEDGIFCVQMKKTLKV